MITIKNDYMDNFCEYLNKLALTGMSVTLVKCEADSVTHDGETFGFAAYVPSQSVMYVATQIDGELTKGFVGPDGTDAEEALRAVVLQSIAHEYIHHLQRFEGRSYAEDEAEDRAKELVNIYYGKPIINWLEGTECWPKEETK